MTPDGSQLRVPASGPLASPKALEIAREIATFDRLVLAGQVGGNTSDPEVTQAMREMARQSRNEAVATLELTYRVAQSTSGPLDAELLNGARKSVELLRQIMSAPPPPSINVHTEITASIPNAVLHYCLRADYDHNICSWQSYDLGAVLHIGLYIFRVQPVGAKGEVREEQVLVLNDPTKRRISQ